MLCTSKIRPPKTLRTSEDIEDEIQTLSDSIINCAKEVVCRSNRPKTSKSHNTPQDILKLIAEKRRLRRKWQSNRQATIKTRINQLTHKIKYMLDRLRVQGYQKYLESLDTRDNSLWRAIAKILNQEPILPAIIYSNTTFATDSEKSSIFATHLEKTFTPHPAYSSDSHILNFVETHFPHPDTSDILFVTPKEILAIVNNLKKNKAPGHEEIRNQMLKNLSKRVLAYLSSIFNACLALDHFSTNWKHAHIFMFPKSGKKKTSVENYRPISLLPTLSKLLERLVLKRISEYIFQIIPSSSIWIQTASLHLSPTSKNNGDN